MAPRSQKVLILLTFIFHNFEIIFTPFLSTFFFFLLDPLISLFLFPLIFLLICIEENFFNENILPLGKRKGEREIEINRTKLRNIEGLRKGNMKITNI